MPLTAERDTKEREARLVSAPVAATKKLFAGGLACLDAAGNATPGAVATTLLAAGRVEETVDNTTGAAGDVRVTYKKGLFKFANHGADLVTRTEIEKTCYIVDDFTVAKTTGGATRSAAGIVKDVDSDGVWVLIA